MAPSKPSLRSSSRQAAAVTDPLLATASEKTDLPTTRGTKRARENASSNNNEEHSIAKRPRLRAQAKPRAARAAAPARAAKTPASPPNKPPTKIIFSEPGTISRATNGVRATLDDTTNTTQCATDEAPRVNGGVKPSNKGKKSEQSDKRTLRSQNGGSRSKSELALYFPNYEEMISNEPKQAEYLTAETTILVIDDGPKPSKPPPSKSESSKSASSPAKTRNVSTNTHAGQLPATTSSPQTPSPKLNDAQKIDFSSIERNAVHAAEDPLTDDVYLKAHRRAERQEKQLRNIEKERAQHEKVQLERLLDGLKGHDWLRVMGISGITESEKKEYEPKRDLFIREVGALVEKFRVWKEEEKRRKVGKTQPPAVNESMPNKPGGDGDRASVVDGLSDGDPPDYSDVDAWAARQLHQEAVSATSKNTTKGKKPPGKTSTLTKPVPPPPPFTSFYTKPYLRAAAIGKHRRGRSRTAFGQPLPEPPDCEFELPPELLNDGATTADVGAQQRRQRRENRVDEEGVKGEGRGPE